jgi:hypothetical protein
MGDGGWMVGDNGRLTTIKVTHDGGNGRDLQAQYIKALAAQTFNILLQMTFGIWMKPIKFIMLSLLLSSHRVERLTIFPAE